MHNILTCSLYCHDDGEVTASVYTSKEIERLGVLHVDSRWSVVPADDDAGSVDAAVYTALACAALGSRLLRLATEIHAQRALFTVRDMGGVGA